jgi:HEAT repeat protein
MPTLAQDSESRNANAAISRQLASPDPSVRQRAAEDLARLAAVDQKKLLEGYYLQEKDRKVRLALEWALYRVGKTEGLFRLVRELDSSRHEQAVGYLKQLDSPTLIYPLLKEQDSPPRITVGLLEALGQLGDRETLELINPFRDSFAPGVAEAAENATDKIEARLAQAEPPVPTRPRTVGKTEPTSP